MNLRYLPHQLSFQGFLLITLLNPTWAQEDSQQRKYSLLVSSFKIILFLSLTRSFKISASLHIVFLILRSLSLSLFKSTAYFDQDVAEACLFFLWKVIQVIALFLNFRSILVVPKYIKILCIFLCNIFFFFCFFYIVMTDFREKLSSFIRHF